MRVRIIVLCIFFYWLSPNVFVAQQILQDSLEVYITSSSDKSSAASISRKEFRTMSASFDDPSRLLTKYAGFANSNDQANDIVYEGLPPHFTKWSLFGAEILNPNHLSNAGTITDTPSRSAGGVNAFSGQILGDFSYRPQPSPASFNALAGMADMQIRSPYKNTKRVQLSLIGLEAGFDQALNPGKSHWLQGNYRYSTIGLLSQLGVDLGDEEIQYQDLSLNYHYKVYENLDVVGYFNFGKSSNEKDTIDQFGEIILRKDYFEVDYQSNNLVSGIHANYSVNSFLFNTTFNYSRREDRYKALKTKENQFASIFIPKHQEDLTEELYSLNLSLEKKKEDLNFGLRYTSLWNYYDVSLNPDFFNHPEFRYSVIQKYKYHSFIPSLFFNQTFISKLSLGFDFKFQYTNRLNDNADKRLSDWKILPSAHLGLELSTKSNLRLQYSSSTQVAPPQQLAYRERFDLISIQSPASEAEHYSLSYNYRAKHQLGIKLYYHKLDQLIAFDQSILASGLNGTIAIKGKRSSLGNTAQIFGVSLSDKTTLFNHQFSANINLFDGSQTINDVKHETYLYEYNFIGSLSIANTIKLNDKRKLGYHISYITRGGQYQPELQSLYPYDFGTGYLNTRTGSYHRVDLRIYLDTKKRNFKHRLSLDIQNVLNRKNDAFQEYNYADYSQHIRKQLGIIPVLSWSVEI